MCEYDECEGSIILVQERCHCILEDTQVGKKKLLKKCTQRTKSSEYQTATIGPCQCTFEADNLAKTLCIIMYMTGSIKSQHIHQLGTQKVAVYKLLRII